MRTPWGVHVAVAVDTVMDTWKTFALARAKNKGEKRRAGAAKEREGTEMGEMGEGTVAEAFTREEKECKEAVWVFVQRVFLSVSVCAVCIKYVIQFIFYLCVSSECVLCVLACVCVSPICVLVFCKVFGLQQATIRISDKPLLKLLPVNAGRQLPLFTCPLYPPLDC